MFLQTVSWVKRRTSGKGDWAFWFGLRGGGCVRSFSLLKTGCQWRQLPRDFPAWCAVYYYFYRGSRDGTWVRLHETLRARVRTRCGRHKHPTAGCLDSQSVKGTAVPGVRGYDARKKVNGRKRHILLDPWVYCWLLW